MKIALLRRGYSVSGGAEAYLKRLARGFILLGHEPTIITSGQWPEADSAGARIVRVKGQGPDAFARDAFAASQGCDMTFSLERVPGCDVFRAGDGVHAAWLDRRAGFEPWWRGATRRFNRKHREILALERQVFDPTIARGIIVNSEMVRREIVDRFGFPEPRIHLVRNGVDVQPVADGVRKSIRASWGIAETELVALFVGSGWERKGLALASDAVGRIKGIRLVVAGRGRGVRLPPGALKLGEVRELGPIYAAADVFILPTWYDPFSNATLEALAHGLPVITTTANGAGEIVEDGITGSIVSPGDRNALCDALRYWQSWECRSNAKNLCLQRAASLTVETNVTATLEVLASIGPR